MNQETLARYPLGEDRAVHHWLACGPVTSPIEHLAQVVKPDGSPFGHDRRWVLNYWAWSAPSKRIKRRLYQQLPPFEWKPPQEHPSLNSEAIGGKRWEYRVAEEDQVIDFSRFNFTPTLMQGWLFTLLETEQSLTVKAELLTIGPARVFLNGELHTHYQREFSYVALQYIPIQLKLKAGLNSLYLHGEMFGWREARLALGLRFLDAYPVQSCIPLGDIPAEQWKLAEEGLNALRVKQFAFPQLPGYIWLGEEATEAFTFKAEVELPIPENVFAQLGTLQRPKAEAEIQLAPGERAELPIVTEVTAGMSGMPGENSLRLRLRPSDGRPLEIDREIWAGSNLFSHEPYSDYEQRRAEALAHLARMPYDVPAAMAALETGTTDRIRSEAVALACHFMENRYDCADFYAIGLLALMYRYGDHPALLEEDQKRIEKAFKGFKYWIDEPGLDAMCYFTENHQVLFHVACYLAGQRWPDWTFENSGRSGREQMRRAQPRIEDWILRRLQGNFSEWDSNAYMTLDAFAMLALVEFSESSRIREMATALLDKLFFLLACQSFRGAHASTHGRCYVTALKSARVENTSSLQRIAWGMGLFNGETRATGLLALARRYRVPDVIQKIGADVNSTLITRARSRARFRPQFDMRGDWWDVTTLTYRAPEVMLSAALDYQPGEMGIQEHLWQATLGPEASVFTTYPGNSQEHGNARPNFWAGSARLPRVGMFERTVICLYQLEANIGLGISHAYFPTMMFDEYTIDGQWAFARCGEGYIALWGDGELILTERGRYAGQELRSAGQGAVWICHVGRAALDGDFRNFQKRVMENTPRVDGLSMIWETPEGDQLAFGWTGNFKVNGQAERWDAYPHYENAYTQTPMDAERMTIAYGGETLTLDLKRGKRQLKIER
jgi:hypothetical protein